MSSTLRQRAQAIADAVTPLSGAERSAVVDIAVGEDAVLRATVEALLAAHSHLPTARVPAPVEAAPIAEGTLLDRYEVHGRLGQGGMARVFSVRHRTLGTWHALKVLHQDDDELHQRLLEEGRIQARLRHDNIVRVTDVVPLDEGVGLVMDRVDGPSLRERLQGGPLAVDEVMELGKGILSGVAAAHAHGLVHRDLKPDNVLLDTTDGRTRPRVADFSLARPHSAPDRSVTRSGVAMGTPGYMAPEQIRDARNAGPPADVFSLGCLLYELVTGQVPFTGRDLVAHYHAAHSGRFPRLSVRAPHVQDALVAVIERALSAHPTDRFPDAGAMGAAWSQACVDAPVPWPATERGAPETLHLSELPQGIFDSDTVQEQVCALLLTDVVDSTAMSERLGDRRMAEVWAAHDRLARGLLSDHGGREIDKTDGFLLLFDDVPAAAAYAIAYHAALRGLSDELGESVEARAGLHLGPVMLRENAPDEVALGAKPLEVEGLAKPTAARVMSLAQGGQTLLTEAALAALGERGPDLRVVCHGHWRLKGVAEPVELHEVGDDHAPFLPPPDGAKVYRVVRDGHDWRPVRDLPHNLPTAPNRSFGRRAELRAIADAFADGARLVTLLGPGGTGKTHLALRYARAWLGDYPGGVWFVDLVEARTAAGVAQALGAALSIPLDADEPFQVLREALAVRATTLVIVDNMEQLIDVVDDTLGGLVGASRSVRWLATSRHRLDLPGERLLPIDPLPLPDLSVGVDPTTVARCPSVQLFVDRARAARPSFTLEAAGIDVVARLVNLLDGLPLALELAAARVRVLPPKRILSRIGRRFDLLKGRRGGGRQSTLKAAIDWSWDLLSPEERAALARCAVFEGSFDLEAAEAVLEIDLDDAPWPTDLVESLVDKSLLRSQEHDGEARFSLFRSIADYARARLEDPTAVRVDGQPLTGPQARQEVEARHAAHYARWGDPEETASLTGIDGRQARERLARDLDNLVVGVHRCVRDQDALTAAALARGALALLEVTGPFTLAEEVGLAALKVVEGEAAAELQLTLGVARTRAGRIDAGRPPLVAALQAAEASQDRLLEARARTAIAHGALRQGDLEAARTGFEAARTGFRSAGDQRGEGECDRELAHILGIRGGRFDEAVPLVESALRCAQAAGDPVGQALAETIAGALACIRGDFDSGRAAYTRARDGAAANGDRRTEGLAEGMLGTIAMLSGDFALASRHYAHALSVQRAIGDRVHEALIVFNDAELKARSGRDEEAADGFLRAVELARANRDPQAEGAALGWLAALRTRTGDREAAEADFARAGALLREAGDLMELTKVVCRMGDSALSAGDLTTARRHLDDARAAAEGLSLDENAELSVMISGFTRALVTASGGGQQPESPQKLA